MNWLHGLSAFMVAFGVYAMALSLSETIRDPTDGVFPFWLGAAFVFFGVAMWQK